MEKVYILYNSDVNEVIAVSKDQSFIEEITCDYFMADVQYMWYWASQWEKSIDIPTMVKHEWKDMLDWYDNYIIIYEEEII